jgi:hypothetical protein
MGVMPTPYVSGRLPLGTPASPAFIAYDPYERGEPDIEGYLADIPYVATGGGNAYNEVHYERPIGVDDDLVVDVTCTDVFEKPGRAGTLLFRTRTTRYTTSPEQGGDLVASNDLRAHPGVRHHPAERRSPMTDAGFTASAGVELPTVTRAPGTEDNVRFAQGNE